MLIFAFTVSTKSEHGMTMNDALTIIHRPIPDVLKGTGLDQGHVVYTRHC